MSGQQPIKWLTADVARIEGEILSLIQVLERKGYLTQQEFQQEFQGWWAEHGSQLSLERWETLKKETQGQANQEGPQL